METRFSAHLPKEVIASMHENDAKQLREIAESFERETASSNLANRSEFLEIADSEDLALGAFARMYDLVVTGVPSEDVSASHLAAHPDMIALHSGRPVLVVPDAYNREGLADHAVVAWDGKRSAARALGDAMSILEEKAKVTVLCVGKTPPEGSDRLVGNLQRHGINAELLVKPKQHSIGQTVLNTTQEISAQLIVMGAYEHSKFSHDLFGGPTTDVIGNAVVPVFLSH